MVFRARERWVTGEPTDGISDVTKADANKKNIERMKEGKPKKASGEPFPSNPNKRRKPKSPTFAQRPRFR